MFQNSKYSTCALSLILIGCTASPTKFVENQYQLTNIDVCRNYLSDAEDIAKRPYEEVTDVERSYFIALSSQMELRKLDRASCETIVEAANAENWTTALIILGAAAAASAAYYESQAEAYRNINENSYSPYNLNYSNGIGYAWDAFYNEYYQLVWVCRDRSNGQFADKYKCAGKVKMDSTWPDK